MNVWVEEQAAIAEGMSLREVEIEAALDLDISRLRGASLASVSEMEAVGYGVDEEEESEESEESSEEEEFDRHAYHRNQKFKEDVYNLKARFLAGEIDQMTYLKEKNRIFEAHGKAAPVPEVQGRRKKGKGIITFAPLTSTLQAGTSH